MTVNRTRLTELRKAASLTQEALARTAGVSVSTVRGLEQGTRRGGYLGTLVRLARVLGVNVLQLVSL